MDKTFKNNDNVRRLYYWNDSVPGYSDYGKRLKLGDRVKIEGVPEYPITRIPFESEEEQRLWLG